MQKLGIFGGAFNPVHWGHLLIAETALTQLHLDRVIWVPSYNPPHKSTPGMLADFHHRLSMVELAIASNPQFALSALEKEHSGWSYALTTLQALQSQWGESQWYWIMGVDAFRSLPRWYGRRTLARECCWLIAPRLSSALEVQLAESLSDPAAAPERIGNHQADFVQNSDWIQQVEQALWSEGIVVQWHLLDMPLVQISSSLVRRYCQERRSIRYLVSEPVRHYILTHNLYCPEPSHDLDLFSEQ